MHKRKALTLTFITFLSMSMPFFTLRSEAAPRISSEAIKEWISTGTATITAAGAVYGGYQGWLKRGETQATYRDQRTSFNYIANCNDQRNTNRFVRQNQAANDYIKHLYPRDPQARQKAALYLIRYACNP